MERVAYTEPDNFNLTILMAATGVCFRVPYLSVPAGNAQIIGLAPLVSAQATASAHRCPDRTAIRPNLRALTQHEPDLLFDSRITYKLSAGPSVSYLDHGRFTPA